MLIFKNIYASWQIILENGIQFYKIYIIYIYLQLALLFTSSLLFPPKNNIVVDNITDDTHF